MNDKELRTNALRSLKSQIKNFILDSQQLPLENSKNRTRFSSFARNVDQQQAPEDIPDFSSSPEPTWQSEIS
jgi:regulator of replication initiation timing